MSPKARFWWTTLAVVAGVAVTASLGRWQLSRAAEKEALQAAIDSRAALPPIGAEHLTAGADTAALLYRPVHLRGRWISERTVFLDNRQMHGQPGFFVVTPLQLQDSPAVVLVQRGWLQRNFIDRTALTPVPTPSGTVDVEGRLTPPPARLYAFKGEDQGAIRQNLDLAAFGAETGLALLPVSVQQTGQDASGLQRAWSSPQTGVEKHYGYAFQWFGLSALLTGLYVWFQFVRRPRRARGAPHA